MDTSVVITEEGEKGGWRWKREGIEEINGDGKNKMK